MDAERVTYLEDMVATYRCAHIFHECHPDDADAGRWLLAAEVRLLNEGRSIFQDRADWLRMGAGEEDVDTRVRSILAGLLGP